MRRIGFLTLMVGLAGCSSQTAPPTDDAPSTPPAVANSAPTPTTPPQPITPTSLDLEEGQLKDFFTELGKRAGHGGWTPQQIENLTKNFKQIKKGDSQSGNLHIDHQGGHEDMMMKAERLDEKKYRITFSGGSASLFDSLKPVLSAFGPQAK